MMMISKQAALVAGGAVTVGLFVSHVRAWAQSSPLSPSVTHPRPGVSHLRVGSAFAEVYNYGAHVTQFYTRSPSQPILFLSSKAVLDGSKPIRGGIPLIFPQFGPNGPLPSHGFARTSPWTTVKESADSDSAQVVFQLTSNDATMKIWPHAFSSRYTVRLLSDQLECDWEIQNTSTTTPFTFTAALHSYFQISDIGNVTLRDFSNLKYIDTAHGGKMCVCQGGDIQIRGEHDRVYCRAPNRLQIVDQDGDIEIVKDAALPDAVVWNPAEVKAAAMNDLNSPEYKTMVCIEPAAIEQPIVLQPGDIFRTRLTLSKSYRGSRL